MVFLAAALIIAWRYDTRQRATFWMAIGIFATSIPLGIQSMLVGDKIASFAIYTAVSYLLGAWCIGLSIAIKFQAPYYHRLALLVSTAVMYGIFYYSQVQDNLALRALILSAGLGMLQMLPLIRVLKHRPRSDLLDAYLYWCYLLFCFYTAMRPLLFWLFEQVLLQDLIHSVYWFVTLLTSILFCMTFSFLLLGSSIRSTLKKLHTERNLDPLTNLLNRRAFNESVQQLLSSDESRPVALVIADIDHFKKINDRWGHDMGDSVLRKLAQCLRQSTRRSDLVARFGGEEFVMLMPNTDTDTAHTIAQRIQNALAQGDSVLPDAHKFTMSFGIAALEPQESMEQAMKRADIALYQAKKSGRNRICLHEADTANQPLPHFLKVARQPALLDEQ